MLEALRRSFIATESEINARIAEKARILEANSKSWAKEVISFLPQDHGLEPLEVEILKLFLADRQKQVYTQNDERGWWTSLTIEWTHKASGIVHERLQENIEEKIKEFCNINGLNFDSHEWVDWRADLRNMALHLARARDELSINIFTGRPSKEDSQKFAKEAYELANKVTNRRKYLSLSACA